MHTLRQFNQSFVQDVQNFLLRGGVLRDWKYPTTFQRVQGFPHDFFCNVHWKFPITYPCYESFSDDDCMGAFPKEMAQ